MPDDTFVQRTETSSSTKAQTYSLVLRAYYPGELIMNENFTVIPDSKKAPVMEQLMAEIARTSSTSGICFRGHLSAPGETPYIFQLFSPTITDVKTNIGAIIDKIAESRKSCSPREL